MSDVFSSFLLFLTICFQIKIGVPAISVDEFFEKNLVSNLASLLGIPENRIQVMEVVSASGSSRRRRRALDVKQISIQIADPPLASVDYEEEEVFTPNGSSNASLPTSAPSPSLQNYTGICFC